MLLGHESLETTMIYTHVARKGPAGVPSPLDLLSELTHETIKAAAAASRQIQGGPVREVRNASRAAQGTCADSPPICH